MWIHLFSHASSHKESLPEVSYLMLLRELVSGHPDVIRHFHSQRQVLQSFHRSFIDKINRWWKIIVIFIEIKEWTVKKEWSNNNEVPNTQKTEAHRQQQIKRKQKQAGKKQYEGNRTYFSPPFSGLRSTLNLLNHGKTMCLMYSRQGFPSTICGGQYAFFILVFTSTYETDDKKNKKPRHWKFKLNMHCCSMLGIYIFSGM